MLLNFIAVIVILSFVYFNPYVFIRGKPGASIFFILYPFIIEFVSIWGIWGAMSSYIGVFAGLVFFSPFDAFQSLILAFIYVIPAMISFTVYRNLMSFFGIDPLKRDLLNTEIKGIKTRRFFSWIVFLIFEAVLLNILQVYIGLNYLIAIGFFSRNIAVYWFYVWSFSNFISCLIIEPILIKTVTESLEELGLVNLGWLY